MVARKNTNLFDRSDESDCTSTKVNILCNEKEKSEWKEDEDKLLLKLANDKVSWYNISETLRNKSKQQCTYRYQKLLKNSKGTKWKRIEDLKIIELIEKAGKNWTFISNFLTGRTPEDIRNRFEEKLDTTFKRTKFTKEEDNLIVNLHDKFGHTWQDIAKHISDRNAAMIKRRYYVIKQELNHSNSKELEYSQSFMSNITSDISSNYSSNLSSNYSLSRATPNLFNKTVSGESINDNTTNYLNYISPFCQEYSFQYSNNYDKEHKHQDDCLSMMLTIPHINKDDFDYPNQSPMNPQIELNHQTSTIYY